MELDVIYSKIYLVRGKNVMLDFDLALKKLSGHKMWPMFHFHTHTCLLHSLSKALQFEFMLMLTEQEKNKVVANCDHLQNLKYSPYLPLAWSFSTWKSSSMFRRSPGKEWATKDRTNNEQKTIMTWGRKFRPQDGAVSDIHHWLSRSNVNF